MSVKTFKRISAIFTLLCIFSCAFFPAAYWNTFTEVFAEETETLEQTPQLKESQVYIYNNNDSLYDMYGMELTNPQSQMVYITGLIEAGYHARVYDSTSETSRNLLGEARLDSTLRGFTLSVPVSGLDANGGKAAVTIQKDGYAESEPISVNYTSTLNPTSFFGLQLVANTSKTYKESGFLRPAFPTSLKKGSYYVANVYITDYPYVSSITIPVKYNTDYFELVPIGANTNKIVTTSTVNAVGVGFSFSGAGNGYMAAKQCGILPGLDTDIESTTKVPKEDIYSSPSSTTVEYPYINTDTGLIKTELAKDTQAGIPPGPFDESTGNFRQSCSILRMVFRCKQNTNSSITMDKLIHFATIDDYPGEIDEEGNPLDPDEATKYYAIAQPSGICVAMGDANTGVTPLKASTATTETLTLNSAQMSSFPTVESSTMSTIPEGYVKIYNYSNSKNDILSGLDEGIPDQLVLNLDSSINNVKVGDKLTIYKDSSLSYSDKIGSGTVESSDGVTISLGNQLDPAGGTVYITKTRGSATSSATAITYPAEANRTVTFKVFRTKLPDGIPDGANLAEYPNALSKIQRGEQIQIRIFFNDINDLMGYSMPIHFNSNIVRAADQRFRELTTEGYVSEQDYVNNVSPFSPGDDLSNLTVNDLIIYNAEESEIDGVIEQLGLSGRSEFDQRKRDVGIKIKFGVSSGEIPWKGGLLFTGERPEGQEDTAYPYIINNSSKASSRDGLIKMFSSALTSSITSLKRDGGYHFMSVNFVGLANVAGQGADFRLPQITDQAYDKAKLCIAGPSDVGSNVNYVWEVYGMEEQKGEPSIELLNGNATVDDVDQFGADYDIDLKSVFVYNQYRYRDPGFKIYNSDGTMPTAAELKTNLKRYYIDKDDGTRVDLPPYEEEEIIATSASNTAGATSNDICFGMTQSHYSKVYDLVYEYTDPNTGQKAEDVHRRVVMIYKRGDVDRRGNVGEEIGQLDEQIMSNHVFRIRLMDLSDTFFLHKTANVDKKGNPGEEIGQLDEQVLSNHAFRISFIKQDYTTDEEIYLMLF